ncbi:MAG: aldo/keto reductase [Proteobacteria bacterium]|nr:aldo/keto reductase [Pseudomonadota bacterium]
MLTTLPFGRTGHTSSRILFGAAALWRASQDEADQALDQLLEAGVNHIDVAASYGDAELRVGAWMPEHRDRFFLATKTGDRDYAGARDSIQRSLERLRVDRIDLIQLHNLVKPDEWEQAFSDDGALRALLEARDAGLVRFLGVTGHGTRVASMHRKSLERFPFDSVLLPYNHSMMRDGDYARDFEALVGECTERGVAVQTIKSIARRRWRDGDAPNRDTWYEPFERQDDIDRATHFALSHPGLFVNTASDLRLLPRILDAAARFGEPPSEGEMAELHTRLAVEPLFVRGYRPDA